MATHILTASSDQVLKRSYDPNVVFWRNCHWWAENGRIHWEDIRDGSYSSISVRECLSRIRALQDMITNTRTSADPDDVFHSAEIADHQRYIAKMSELCRRARAQGDPDDPEVRRRRRHEIRRSRARRGQIK